VKPASATWSAILSCAAGVFAFSCAWHESRALLQVDVAADAGEIRFSTARCDGRSDPVDTYLLAVVEELTNDSVREKCTVTRVAMSDRILPRSWRMGDSVPGFVIEGCDPLPAGSYLVSVRGSGRLGSRSFRVTTDGQVLTTSRPCP